MSDFDEKPTFIHENRRLAEAHDKATEQLEITWSGIYSQDNYKDMHVQCTNGDWVLCDEAQEIFNKHYETALESEMHV